MKRFCTMLVVAIAYLFLVASANPTQLNVTSTTTIDECNRLLERSTYKVSTVRGSNKKLYLFDMTDARSLEPAVARVGLLDSLRLLCHHRYPKSTYDGAVSIDHKTMTYHIEGLQHITYELMTWDEACIATRGLLDYLEYSEPYYLEQAFLVFRKKNLIGSGHLMNNTRTPRPRPSADAGGVAAENEIFARSGDMTVDEILKDIDALENKKDASCQLKDQYDLKGSEDIPVFR